MRSDLLRYASKKIFSLCIMVVGHTHGLGGSKGCSRLGRRSGDLMPSLGGSKGCSRLGHRSGDLMPSLISLGKTAGDRCFENSSLVSAAVRECSRLGHRSGAYKIVRRYGGLPQII